MKEHPHAWALRLIADGVPVEEFETNHLDYWEEGSWAPAGTFRGWISENPEKWQVRRKAKTIKVNGFDVPEPCKEMPKSGNMYGVSLFLNSFYSYIGQAEDVNTLIQNALRNGVLHTTPEAAAAHGKALLGIDPSK